MLFYHASDIQALKYKMKKIWGECSEILRTDEGNCKRNLSRLWAPSQNFERRQLESSCLSAHLSTWNNSTPNG
jgi:hypothetical protein